MYVVNICSAQCLNNVLNLKALVGAYKLEKALVAGAFFVTTNLCVDLRLKLYTTGQGDDAAGL